MRRWITTCALALILVGLSPLPVAAQTASERQHAAALKRGNAAYNGGDYKSATAAYVLAIQAAPDKDVAYRNLARAFFWDGDYPAAVEYYDYYLRLGGADQEKVKSERRLAADRAGERVFTPPEAQALALAALESELESGRAYTAGGGGAWGRYETLLRTKYAEPHLSKLRARLTRRLLDEFDAHLIPKSNQITPRLDLDGWQLQSERLAVAGNVVDDPGMLDVLKRRSTVVEAAVAMLTSRYASAADLAKLARESNPDLGFVAWFEVSSLVGAERYDDALARLTDLAAELSGRDEARLDYVRVLRAVILQRLGRDAEAAALYLEVLR